MTSGLLRARLAVLEERLLQHAARAVGSGDATVVGAGSGEAGAGAGDGDGDGDGGGSGPDPQAPAAGPPTTGHETDGDDHSHYGDHDSLPYGDDDSLLYGDHDSLHYGEDDSLAHVEREFGLSRTERDLLVACVLPELSTVCGAACRVLTGAAPASRPTVAVALGILGITPAQAVTRGLLRTGGPLLDSGLVRYENPEAPYPDRLLRVPDRVLDFLVGAPQPASATGGLLRRLPAGPGSVADEAVDRLVEALSRSGTGSLYIREGIDGWALPAAGAALRELGRVPLLVAPEDVEDGPADLPALLADAVLEARLLGGGVIVPAFTPPDGPAGSLLRAVLRTLERVPLPLVVYGGEEWDAEAWGVAPTGSVDLSATPPSEWEAGAPGREPVNAAAASVVDRARRTAALHGGVFGPGDAGSLAQQCAAQHLARLARHIRPQVTWSDLVLPAAVRERLDMLIFRIRHREQVLGEWGLRRGGGRGWGATALFSGESGTGKTMAAEAMAGELGVDLFTVSLPTVVSKYVGETEKNLERIFCAAESLGGVVLFDEADSMFAKRGAVRDANDKYAAMQSGYLLQRLEAFGGLAVLTTNLRSNMDSAFTRRFDEAIEFESPGPDVRARLWRKFLGAALADSCDIDRMATAFPIAGGSIRASVETAAFAAAAAGRKVSTEDLLNAVEVEYRKQGRLFDRPEPLSP
ncbi:ATP-binding protein [Streptomyces sp. NPDC001339]|uniref:ATP-binding protein n=1 Tax=Streptomyces sp. NPDC001339 TaxID=3364563 RepID=UPI0036BE824E